MLPWREQIIELPGGRMNAVSFGKGPRPMLLISGLNLRDVRGPDAAFGLWALYRGFGRDHVEISENALNAIATEIATTSVSSHSRP